MIRRTLAAALAVSAITGGIALAQPIGMEITLDGKAFKIGEWGFPYWSGKKEIYGAYRHGRRNEISYKADIVIEQPGNTWAGWNVKYEDVPGGVNQQSCPEEERIIRDLARLAGLSVQQFKVGECKTNFQQGPNNYRSGGVIDFSRTTPVIAPMAKLPSGSGTPSPQGTVRFAPLGSGSSAPSPAAAPLPVAPPPGPSAQDLAEIAEQERLNREQADFAARQVAENAAAKAAFDKANAEYEATIAAQKAQVERQEREYQAAMAKWRADVEACKQGDFSRCGQ